MRRDYGYVRVRIEPDPWDRALGGCLVAFLSVLAVKVLILVILIVASFLPYWVTK